MKCAVWRWFLCLLPLLLLLPEAVALKSAARIQEVEAGDADDDGGDNSDDAQSADGNADDSSADQDSSDSAEGEEQNKDTDGQSEDQSDSDDNSDSQDQAASTTPVSVTKAAAKPRRNVPNALDISGLSKSLKDGGVEGLTRMLTAWKAARGNRNTDAQFHIKRDAQGHAVYDFHDMFKRPDVTTLPPQEVAPAALPGDVAQGIGKNLLKAQRSAATVLPPTAPAADQAAHEAQMKPSPKIAKVAGLPSPDDLMKQLLGALPPGMSDQIKLNVDKKEEVKSTAATTSSKAPVPVTTQAATTQAVTTQAPVPVTTQAATTRAVTTKAPVPVTTHAATTQAVTTKAPVPVTTQAATMKAATTKVVQMADDSKEMDDFADSEVDDLADKEVHESADEAKAGLANQQALVKLQEEFAKQAQLLNATQAAQRSEAAELNKVEQDNHKLHAEIRKLVHLVHHKA